jgi:hypothetical protein
MFGDRSMPVGTTFKLTGGDTQTVSGVISTESGLAMGWQFFRTAEMHADRYRHYQNGWDQWVADGLHRSHGKADRLIGASRGVEARSGRRPAALSADRLASR